MRYLSVCSGIEAATAAWHPLGWSPVAFSEIEKFPSAVLAHHYGSNMPGDPLSANGIPNLGDMTKFEEWPDYAIDVLVGGTPCQSFSIAGLRKGLADPRGNLMLTYLAIAARYRPTWLVWENVPGALSSWSCPDEAVDLQEGEEREVEEVSDFGCLLEGFQQLGYGFSYRILDAQFIRVDSHRRAVPQRRNRVFVVGYLGDWRRAAAVFLEPESLSGNPAPRREAGKDVAPTISARTSGGGGLGTDFDLDGGLIADEAARCVTAGYAQRLDWETENFVATRSVAATLTRGAESSGKGGYAGRRQEDDDNLVAHPLLAKANSSHDDTMETYVAHALRGEGFDASEDGTGRGTPLVPVFAMQERMESLNPNHGPNGKGWADEGAAFTLEARHRPQSVAFDLRGREGGAQFEGPHDTANIRAASGGSSRSYVAQQWAVRRLTPRECERLQGFPDDFTNIPWRGKDEAPDGPRYKALGNSMAVNVMRFIGERIAMVERVAPSKRRKDAA